MCPAENKQVFLSFYSYLNITGREKKERKKKEIAKFVNEMNLSDRRPLSYPWNTADEIKQRNGNDILFLTIIVRSLLFSSFFLINTM